MYVPDLVAAWRGLIDQQAQDECLVVDWRYVDLQQRRVAPCPVCGTVPTRRDPYPGQTLETYRDLLTGLIIPHWACSPCAALERADRSAEFAARVRCRLAEWLPDLRGGKGDG